MGGMDLHTILCPKCESQCETVEHRLLFCEKVMKVWENIFQWWGLRLNDSFTINDIILHTGNSNMSKDSKMLWSSVVWVTAYMVWKDRNNKVFKGKSENIEKLVQEIQVRSFEWINRRSKKGEFSWDQWLHSPNMCKLTVCPGTGISSGG